MRLLSVDPSIVAIGVAELEDGKPVSAYTLRTDDSTPVEHRLRVIAEHFAALKGPFDAAIVEMPDKFVRLGARGITNFGSIQLLHLAIGTIVGVLVQKHNVIVHLVRVSEWKGKGQKWQTQLVAKQITGKKLNTHEADAVMMGINWTERKRIRHVLEK